MLIRPVLDLEVFSQRAQEIIPQPGGYLVSGTLRSAMAIPSVKIFSAITK